MAVTTERTYVISEGDVSIRFVGRGGNFTIEVYVDSRYELGSPDELVASMSASIADLEDICQKMRHDDQRG